MRIPPGDRLVARSDIRYAREWILGRVQHLLFTLALLVAAGALSAMGRLAWQAPLLRWSFALLCWVVAAYLVLAFRRRGHAACTRFD